MTTPLLRSDKTIVWCIYAFLLLGAKFVNVEGLAGFSFWCANLSCFCYEVFIHQ